MKTREELALEITQAEIDNKIAHTRLINAQAKQIENKNKEEPKT